MNESFYCPFSGKEAEMSEVKRRRHTPQQIVEKLREADRLLNAGQSLGQVLQALEVSESTCSQCTSRHSFV